MSIGKDKDADAVALLLEDQERIRQLFTDYQQLQSDATAADTKCALVHQLSVALRLHAWIMEEIFYPTVQKWWDSENLVKDLMLFHDEMRALLIQVSEMHPNDEFHDALMTILGECVDRHFLDEREKVFAKLQSSGVDMHTLGHRIRQRRKEICLQLPAFVPAVI